MRSPHLDHLKAPTKGFRARLPREDDLPGLVELYNAVARQRQLRLVEEADLLAHRTQPDWWTEAIVVERKSDELLAAYTHYSVEPGPAGSLSVWLDGRVHPEATGQGLASFLIERGQRRAWLASSQRHLHGRLSVVTTNDNGNDRARALYERLGFTAIRHRLAMHIDLGVPRAGKGPEAWGLTIRPFEVERDARPLWEAMQAGFEDHHGFEPTPFEEWRWILIDRHGDEFDPGLWFVAEADGEVVGGLVAEVGVPDDARQGHVKDLAVVPAWRRRGVADALLRAVFAAFAARGLDRAGLDVDEVSLTAGAVRLYERAGMAVARRIDIYEKVLRDG